VLARVFAIEDDIKSNAGQKAAWARAAELMRALPAACAPGELNQGLMELGATICSPAQPRCLACPLAAACVANRTGRQAELPVMPVRKKAHELPELARTLAWLGRGETVVLVRRAPEGLFGGLWELPPAELARALGAKIDDTPVAYHDQVLTHRRLRVTVVRGAAPARLVLPPDPGYDAIIRVGMTAAKQLGIAAATAAILTKYEDIPWSSTPRPSPSSRRATTRSSKASRRSASTSPTRTSRTRPRARRRASTS
jgi:adenine-specific DNA glycosylase